jgi:hypothetical protein
LVVGEAVAPALVHALAAMAAMASMPSTREPLEITDQSSFSPLDQGSSALPPRTTRAVSGLVGAA